MLIKMETSKIKMNKKGIFGMIVFAFILIVLIVGGIALVYTTVYTTVDYTTITIKEKERITDGMDSYYLIFTENEVFKNEDSFLMWKFDSSDIYNQLNVGQTYNVKVNWFRVPLLSSYRNILEIENESN